MSTGKLILHPGSVESSLTEAKHLIDSLSKMKLIGLPIDSEANRFLAGEHFLQLISFIGCSTNVCLTPSGDTANNFCHLSINGPLPQPLLIWDKSSRPPRCPSCQKSMPDWKAHTNSLEIKCSSCGNESNLEDISWGRHAGYVRMFIEISNIFPSEAKPANKLIDDLSKLTGTKWNYFYHSQETE